MNVKYTGPAKDYSGYGEANRHDIAALVASDIDVTTKLPQYCMEISNYGELGRIATSREGKDIPYDIVILHTTPNVYPIHLEPGKYHVGRVFWETDRLPKDFADGIKHVDEIWTGSEFNRRAIINAGVTNIPIYIIPEAVDVVGFDALDIKPYQIPNENTYKFYSIFEWTERKNPLALLTAYFTEFQHDEKVSLTIKTYIDNFTPTKRAEIMELVKQAKKRLNLEKYPDLYIYDNLMERSQIYRFHKTFDCFVSAHRGEGWGIPQMEALLAGKPVISTNVGGIHEYLTHGTHALLIPYTMTPLAKNNRNTQWYTIDQNWADVSVAELRLAMRSAYEHQLEAATMGEAGRKLVRQKFNLKAVGDMMKERLEIINNTLHPNGTGALLQEHTPETTGTTE